MPRKLRPVQPGERAEKPRKRLTVTEAAALNHHRELLVALQARISQSVESATVPPVALAALSRQLVLISKELAVLNTNPAEDPVGEAAAIPDEAWDGAV